MKNIHIIPTDKASRIHLDKRSKELLVYENFNKEDRYTSTHNIYITSDEEIISLSEINSLPLSDGKDIQTNMSNI